MKRILCLTLMLALVLSAVLAPTAALAASNYTCLLYTSDAADD